MRRLFKLLIVLVMTLTFSSIAMAGWEQDAAGWKYKNDDGTYKTEWYQDIDKKWYYFDGTSGYMLTNTTTPDGFYVSSSGEWVKEMKSNAENGYKNKAELKISALAVSSTKTTSLGYEVPITVFYNDSYNNPGGGTIEVRGVEKSKEGVPFILLSAKGVEGGRIIRYSHISKYFLSDGTVIERTIRVPRLSGGQDVDFIDMLIRNDLDMERSFQLQQITSVEIRIGEATE